VVSFRAELRRTIYKRPEPSGPVRNKPKQAVGDAEIPSPLTYDRLDFKAVYGAPWYSVLDETGTEVGRVEARDGWVALNDARGERVLAFESTEYDRKAALRVARTESPVAIVDDRGLTVVTILGKHGEILDASGQRIGTLATSWRHATTTRIEDTGTAEAGRVTRPLVPRSEDGLLACAAVTLNANATPELRLATLGYTVWLIETLARETRRLLQRFRVEPPAA
jgi:hypothetical protein